MRIDDLVRRESPARIHRSSRGSDRYYDRGSYISHELTIDEKEGGYDPQKGDGSHIHRLYHWGTLMAKWDCNQPKLGEYYIGYGSVSDQTLMNELFQSLHIPFRMDRDRRGGGARITVNWPENELHGN